MKTLATASILCSALCALAAPASAQLLTPVSQERIIEASAQFEVSSVVVDSNSDADTAPDFGPWIGGAQASANHLNYQSSSVGTQDSSILDDRIIATGSSSCGANQVSVPAVRAWGEALSRTQVTFDVSTHVLATISGQLLSDGAYGSASASLRTPNGPIWSQGISSHFNMVDVDEAIVLAPGRYIFNVQANNAAVSDEFIHYFGLGDYALTLVLSELVTSYCIGAPNSAGPGATLSASGSLSIADNDFSVHVAGATPGDVGLFYYGTSTTQVPFGDGFRCVGGSTFRLPPALLADATGSASRQLDFGSAPTGGGGAGSILPLSTWNLQYWYRDPNSSGSSNFNLSNALAVTLQP